MAVHDARHCDCGRDGHRQRTVRGAAGRRPESGPAAVEAGRAAVGGQDWCFIDMEHGPFSMDQLESTLAQMGKDRDASGRLKLAPLVRIPQEGDEDFRWAVKQVLDAGAFGIVLPHVDTAEEAAKLVRTMRYPPTRDSKYPTPRGERGWGPTRAVRLWGPTRPHTTARPTSGRSIQTASFSPWR